MDNGNIYPPTLLEKYPHMFPLDIAIWERWISRFGSNYDGIEYDVKVGSGTEPDPSLREPYRTMQLTLSRYRIDAVGYQPDRLTIFEVKPEAGTVALGQIQLYIDLYTRDYSPTLPIVGAIVTDRELPDMSYFCEKNGIELYILPGESE